MIILCNFTLLVHMKSIIKIRNCYCYNIIMSFFLFFFLFSFSFFEKYIMSFLVNNKIHHLFFLHFIITLSFEIVEGTKD